MSDAYMSLGASSEKADVRRAIEKIDRGVFAGAFCKLIDDPAGDPAWCAALHADGAGTKSSLAYIKHRETGDFSAYYDIAQDSVVMNLDDLLCVGATGGFVMSNTIGRNAHLVDGNAIKAVIEGYVGFITKIRGLGVDIAMSGGETADVGDIVRTLIVDSTFFVRMRRADVVDCGNISRGDAIVGFASFGKATYESKHNSGMGSNGLTAARHLLLSHYYAEKYSETFSPTIDKSKAYCGRYRIGDMLPGCLAVPAMTVGDALLSPTRTYAPVVRDILAAGRARIHGIIHCTGGGQLKCRNFGRGLRYVKDSLFDTPPLFRAIAESGSIGAREMYSVFNMGHRLEMFCEPEYAPQLIATAAKYGIEAKVIGRVEPSDGENSVIIKHNGEIFEY